MKAFKTPLDKTQFPEPFIEGEPELTQLYWRAWEIAWDHVYHTPEAPQTPYIDEAWGAKKIWIWDTCFIALYCRYAPHVFPGIESLTNFYAPIHENIRSSLRIEHIDNPPLFAWVEHEYFKFTGNLERLKWLLLEKQYLQKHYNFIYNMKHFKRKKIGVIPTMAKRRALGYQWSGTRSGMDNTPRGRKWYPSILWMDLLAQQGLSAINIVKLARFLNKTDIIEIYQKEYDSIKNLLNEYYWNDEDGVYYDIKKKNPSVQVKVKTPATYWPMLAEMCSEAQAKKLAENATDPNCFGGKIPYPSVSRDDPDFNPKGKYWRGGVWLPMAYLITKALEKYEYHDIAANNAYNLVKNMVDTYNKYEPHTIWEAYSPTEQMPATKRFNREKVKPEFCGWSALGPISMFIENILGFYDINTLNRTVKWRLYRKEPHGIRRLRFGSIIADIIYSDSVISVDTNQPFNLDVNNKLYKIEKKTQKIEIS